MSHTVILVGDTHREYARRLIAQAPMGSAVVFKDATRTDDQNSKLWPLLQDVSRQVEWYGAKLSDHEWKDVFTAAPNGIAMVPDRTS